jgi:8-oxo-dGTP pyrophosphatase MutT (NUDIX family)
MHRRPLLALIEAHRTRHPEDDERARAVMHFVRGHVDCFERRCAPGHVTGSAWIVSPDHGQVLLTHHRKLGRWLQLGGHADGDPEVFAVALREAREESGLSHFSTLPGGAERLLDLDVHEIPANRSEPAHLHLDVRFLLIAAPGQVLRCSEESEALRWVPWADLPELATEASLLRMARRAQLLLEQAG